MANAPRTDEVLSQARAATLALDTPEKAGQDARDGDVPVENQNWTPPATLETPPAPAGYHLTWVRTMAGKQDDADNVRKMFSQGWRPVLASEIPPGYFPPTISDVRFNNGQATVGVRDMILCKIPLRMKRQRDEYYQRAANVQVSEIDKRLHAESRRPGDKFTSERNSTTELRTVPPSDDDTDS